MFRKIGVIIVLFQTMLCIGQETEGDFIEFDDRKNVVHGVYIGLFQHITQISNRSTGLVNLKLAYVANKQLEVGISANVFFSKQPNNTTLFEGEYVSLFGGYMGLHLEPILYGRHKFSLSFPIMLGGGVITILKYNEDGTLSERNFNKDSQIVDEFLIVEPGFNVLYNISRFLQIEAGILYRVSTNYELKVFEDNINGFSAGMGLKMGIFNLGRKKKIKDDFVSL